MSSLNNFQEDHYQDRFQSGVLGFFDKIVSETIPKNKNLFIVSLIAIIGGCFYFLNSKSAASHAVMIEQEQLGKIIVLAQQGKVAEQELALDELIGSKSLSVQTQVKANLMRADLYFQAMAYDQALSSYQKVQSMGMQNPIVMSAADQGVASAFMQQKKYPEAKTALEQFVIKYSLRSDDPAERHSSNSQEDLVPFVPAALFKLALVNVELKDKASAKLAVEKILKVYPESNEARLAKQLIETL